MKKIIKLPFGIIKCVENGRTLWLDFSEVEDMSKAVEYLITEGA